MVQNCHLADVAYGIKQIFMIFTMGMKASSDDDVDVIKALGDKVQSVEINLMSLL